MSDYIDLGGLAHVAIASLLFSSVLAAVYGVGIVGAARGTVAGARRPLPLAVAGIAFALFVAAVAFGIVLMARK